MSVPRWLLMASALAACGRSDAPPTYAVRDSAGVTIVESMAPAWTPGEAWTVSPEPVLHIGVVEGAPEYMFTLIAGVFEDAGGRIVVGDASEEVRFYDQAGAFLGAFGRQGEGPGEFRVLGRLEPYLGDSILAYDGPARRLSVFDPEGRFVRAVTIQSARPPNLGEPDGPAVWIPGGFITALADGTLLAGAGSTLSGSPGEVVPEENWLVRYDAEGDTLALLGPFVSRTRIPDFSHSLRLAEPFGGPPLVLGFASAAIHTGNGSSFEVRTMSYEGELQRILRSSHLDLTLTDEHRESYRVSERTRLDGSADPAEVERRLMEATFPPTIPAYSQLLVDSEGHLWVRHYSTRWTPGPETWSIFSPEGYLLGTIQTPERLQVRQIGTDFLLGIWTDELDVRYVRKYALSRLD